MEAFFQQPIKLFVAMPGDGVTSYPIKGATAQNTHIYRNGGLLAASDWSASSTSITIPKASRLGECFAFLLDEGGGGGGDVSWPKTDEPYVAIGDPEDKWALLSDQTLDEGTY